MSEQLGDDQADWIPAAFLSMPIGRIPRIKIKPLLCSVSPPPRFSVLLITSGFLGSTLKSFAPVTGEARVTDTL